MTPPLTRPARACQMRDVVLLVLDECHHAVKRCALPSRHPLRRDSAAMRFSLC